MPEQNHTFDVAIIGAGFSDAMTGVHLARLAPELRVLLCDKEGAFARGVAYGTRMRGHLLNVPAGKMSAFADESDHFFKWLESRADELRKIGIAEISRDAFLPRQIYGSYLRDVLAEARKQASGLEISATEIVDIEPENGALVLQSSDGAQIRARRVVLAMGNFPPGDPPMRDRSFHRHARYINSPWSAERLRQISEDDDVLILGSGLTTLDLLVTLDANKTRGVIHVISRRGLFPQPHKKIAPRPDWFNAQQREIFPNTIRALVRFLRSEIKRAAAEGTDWRAIVDALRPHTQRLWQKLSVPERRRFMRHVRPFWESHRHRAAPDVLAVKDKMIACGQVIFHKARVTKIREAPDGLEVSFFDRDAKCEEILRVGYVVNCTGPECNYHKLKQPLVVNLLARGLIHPDPLFLGLLTESNGAVVNYLGRPSERIFTLGSLKKGMLFETTAVPELRVQAKELAEDLVKSFREKREKISAPLNAHIAKHRGNFSREEKPDDSEGNLIIISNRGPNDFVWQDEQWTPRSSSGGLVSMIAPLARNADVTWFCCVSEPPDASDARTALFTTAADQTAESEMHVVPVPMPARVYNAYYGQISNEVLWMLQHHLVGRFGYSSLDAERHRAWREGYFEANRRVLKAIRAFAATGVKPRAFLIQDYHLYPLPAMLREAFPDVPSLHFTHIPFPDAATWKLIPRDWRETILRGLLGADVVGMQTLWDARPFLGCCEELLGAKVDYKNSTVLAPDGRTVKVRAFPASTDPDEVRETLRSPAVAEARERLAPDLTDLSIVRVDRLDPSKNQVIGFEAFGRLLEMRPDLRGRVRFLAFLVPSRTDLSVYRAYRDAVYASIETVNEHFTKDCGFPPIKVFYTNNREQALAAMERCDALLVNSREDGMNLVVKEWALVSQRPGVAIISETAGVAADLNEDALLVCPLDIEGTAEAMSCALDMPIVNRAERLKALRKKVIEWTAADWLSQQLAELRIELVSQKQTTSF